MQNFVYTNVYVCCPLLPVWNKWNLASCEGSYLHSHCSEVTTSIN